MSLRMLAEQRLNKWASFMTVNCNQGNQFLLGMASSDGAALKPHIFRAPLAPGVVLFEQGEEIDRVYFPDSGQVSLIVVDEDGAEVEGAAIGCEGVVGLGAALRAGPSFTRQQVRLRGEARVMLRTPFVEAVATSPSLRRTIAIHHDAFAAQLLQSSFCSAVHSAEQRVARWLLAAFDTVPDAVLDITQDGIARALGLTRPTVTGALSAGSSTGLVQLERGRILLRDRARLEAMACDCYRIIRRAFVEAESMGPSP